MRSCYHCRMMSQYNIVPRWNSNHQWQAPEQAAPEQEAMSSSISSHVQPQQPIPSYLVPHSMSNHEVAELTWENGLPRPTVHGYSGMFSAAASAKPTWEASSASQDTLESIVYQAKSLNQKGLMKPTKSQEEKDVAGDGKRDESVEKVNIGRGKRMRSETLDDCGRFFSRSGLLLPDDEAAAAERNRSGCGCGSATFCRENDAHTSMRASWVSLDSPRSLMTKTTFEDSGFHGCSKIREEDEENKGETFRSNNTRRSRPADMHNESERRRRHRINQKLKALQKLVPNAGKSDKASMLDEVIEYLKKLKAQVNLMGSRIIPQMMMNPLAMQQLLQMSLLPGNGMGILDTSPLAPCLTPSFQPLVHTNPMASATPTLLPAAFLVPPTVLPCPPPRAATSDGSANGSFSDPHPYAAYFGQKTENMDFYRKMAALYGEATASQFGQTMTPSDQNLVHTE